MNAQKAQTHPVVVGSGLCDTIYIANPSRVCVNSPIVPVDNEKHSKIDENGKEGKITMDNYPSEPKRMNGEERQRESRVREKRTHG